MKAQENTLNEIEWLERLNNGDLQWFDQFVQQYNRRIFSMCWRFTLTQTDAEDLAQEIFLQLYRNINQFRGESALSTWIYRVALNKALDSGRKQKRNRSAPLREATDVSMINGNRDCIEHAGKSLDINRSIAKLPEKYRKIIELYFFQDLSQKTIANVLQVPVKTVETRIYRAKMRLKDILIQSGYGEEDIDG